MRKIGVALLLAFLLVPSVGWARNYVFWFTIPQCHGFSQECNNPEYPGCHLCDLYLHIGTESGAEVRFIARTRDPLYPHRIDIQSEELIQTEPHQTYDLDKIMNLPVRGNPEFPFLEVIVKTKGGFKPELVLEVMSADGNYNFELHPIERP